MASEIQRHATSAVSASDDEIVSPLSAWTLFWRPRFLRASPDLVHIPFLFWLTFTLRPSVSVTVGNADGLAHFAFCQAADKLDLEMRCLGFGPWGGVSEGVPEDLSTYNDENYREISLLHEQSPDDGGQRVPEASVDLMFVSLNGGAESEALAKWLEGDWIARLTRRGVLLLNAANALLGAATPGSLIDRLLKRYPYFHVDIGEGLLLFAVGEDQHDSLARLCKLKLGDRGHGTLTQIFSRIGHGLETEVTARLGSRRIKALEVDRDDLRQRLTSLQDEHGRSEEERSRLQQAYHERTRVAADAQARVIDLQLDANVAKTNVERLSAQVDAMTREIEVRKADAEVMGLTLEKQTAEVAELREALTTTSKKETWLRQERERLSELSEGYKTELEQMRSHADGAMRQISGLTDNLAELEVKRAALESQQAGLAATNADLETALTERGAEVESLRGSLSEATARGEALAESLRVAETALTERGAEVESRDAEIERLRMERDHGLGDVQALLVVSEGSVAALQARLDEALAERAVQERQLSELGESLTLTEARAEDSAARALALETSIDEKDQLLTQRGEQAAQALGHAEQRIAALTMEVAALVEVAEQGQQTRDQALREAEGQALADAAAIADLQAQLAELIETGHALTAQAAQMQAHLDAAADATGTAEARIASLSAALAIFTRDAEASANERDAEIERLRMERDRALGDVQALVAQMTEQSTEAQARSAQILDVVTRSTERAVNERDAELRIMRARISDLEAEITARADAERRLREEIDRRLGFDDAGTQGPVVDLPPGVAGSDYAGQLAALVSSYEQRRIIQDDERDTSRRVIDGLHREKEALVGLLAEHGIATDRLPSGPVGSITRLATVSPVIRKGEALKSRLKGQLAVVEALQSVLTPRGEGEG